MCSTSQVNDLLKITNQSSNGNGTIAVGKLLHNRSFYYVVDVREALEVTEQPLGSSINANENIPLGKLLSMSNETLLDKFQDRDAIVLCCSSGYRSGLAAEQLRDRLGFTNKIIHSLSRGMIPLQNPAATVPDFLVILATNSNAEKLTLALNACTVAAKAGETVVLVLMGDGVSTFTTVVPEGNTSHVQSTNLGAPFSPTGVLLEQFETTGNGVILACSSCVKSRQLTFGKDLLTCVKPMQMPDMLRMLGETKKNLQFM